MISLVRMLRGARDGRFAVGAFNGVDNYFIDAIFDAAQHLEAPVIINVAEVHLKFISLEDIAAYVRYKAETTGLPTTLNLDHGQTFATAMRALAAGFTSVMFDGSHLSYEDNIRETAAVAKACHARGVSVEGELGAVGGDEGGALESRADEAYYTDPAKAADFVVRTKIDALAVAIGNSHGKYKGVPKLDFARLETLSNTVDVPLVLHGGSGLSDDDFRRAVSLGIAKINFYTGMSQAALTSLGADLLDAELALKYDHYLMSMTRARKAVGEAVADRIGVFGSAGKAGAYHD